MRFKSSSSSRRTLTTPREKIRLFSSLFHCASLARLLRLSDLNAGHTKEGKAASSLSRSLLDISPSLRDPITFKWPEIERFRREREREERPVQDILGRRERVAPIVSSCPAYASLRRYSDVQIHCLGGRKCNEFSRILEPLPHS